MYKFKLQSEWFLFQLNKILKFSLHDWFFICFTLNFIRIKKSFTKNFENAQNLFEIKDGRAICVNQTKELTLNLKNIVQLKS